MKAAAPSCLKLVALSGSEWSLSHNLLKICKFTQGSLINKMANEFIKIWDRSDYEPRNSIFPLIFPFSCDGDETSAIKFVSPQLF